MKNEFTVDLNGDINGILVAKMVQGQRVKLIPFLDYNDQDIYWIHSDDEEEFEGEGKCLSCFKEKINKTFYFDTKKHGATTLIEREKDDDDDRYYDSNWEDVVIPECCLMPLGMKVSELPRPTNKKMAKLYDEYIKKYESEEDDNMSKLGGMLTRMFGEVGQVNDGSLALTLNGEVAVKRKDGDYVRYNKDGENLENQASFILEGSDKFMMLMPSPTVEKGDIIKNKDKFLQVIEIKENGNISTINFETGAKTTIIKETNLFGMQFYTKVVSMMTSMTNQTGAFNPLMMLILSKDEEGSENKMDMTTMLMLSGMFGGQGATGQMNPMMMLALLGDKEGGQGSSMKDMMMMSMFMGGNSPLSNLFGQTNLTKTPDVSNYKQADTNLEALVKSQAESITQLNNKIKELTEKTQNGNINE